MKESATPELESFTFTKTRVHPLSRRRVQTASRKAVCICFTITKSGWSTAITGFCPGFRKLTALLTKSMACLIIEDNFGSSWNKGSRLNIPGVWFPRHLRCCWESLTTPGYSLFLSILCSQLISQFSSTDDEVQLPCAIVCVVYTRKLPFSSPVIQNQSTKILWKQRLYENIVLTVL